MSKDKPKKKVNLLLIFNIVTVLIVFILISNVVTVLNTTLENNFEIQISKEVIKENFENFDTYKALFKIETPLNVIGLVAWIVFSIKTIFPKKKHSTYEESYDYGSHGTSKWQSERDILSNYYNNKKGWFLGSLNKNEKFKNMMDVAYHPVDGDLNMQMVVVGAPGSQKTTGFVYPNIFHICDVYKESTEKADMIITDPKSELFSRTSKYLESNGYEVKVLDFIHLKHGNAFNPLEFINDDKTLMEIAQGYVHSVEGSLGGNNGDSFWSEQEGQLLGALIGFVKQVYKEDKSKQTFTEVSKILTSENVMDYDKAKIFFTKHNVKGAPLQLWNNYLGVAKADNTRSGIVGGLAVKLKLFAIDGIANISSSTDIDINLLGRKINEKKRKPIALFIFMPDNDRTFAPIINSIVTIIFKQLYKTAYETDNRLDNPVYFFLEEMANIGKISGIQEMLGTMRGRRIYPMMVWQSLSQMKNRYTHDGMEDLMSQCDTHVYLGINDDFTAEYCSKSLGETTIKVKSSSSNDNGSGESDSYKSRRLLFADECMKLDNSKLIIKQRAKDPMLINKVQYKYWENEICEFKKVSELPQLKNRVKFDEDIITNKINEKELTNKKETTNKTEEYINKNSDKLEKEMGNMLDEILNFNK